MKKLLSLIFVALMLMAMPVLAEDLDPSEMTLDELVKLHTLIHDELVKRIDDNRTMIYVGDYLAGTDIKPGAYLITCTKKHTSKYSMIIAVYHSDEIYDNHADDDNYNFKVNAVKFVEINEMDSAIIQLEAGDHLIIRHGEGLCVPYQATWAP